MPLAWAVVRARSIDLARHHGMDRQACQILYNCQASAVGSLSITSTDSVSLLARILRALSV
jgi:hypothetical protein